MIRKFADSSRYYKLSKCSRAAKILSLTCRAGPWSASDPQVALGMVAAPLLRWESRPRLPEWLRPTNGLLLSVSDEPAAIWRFIPKISEGAYAHAGQQMFVLIDARTWWAVANFREGQL
jgi:hypothetical protein